MDYGVQYYLEKHKNANLDELFEKRASISLELYETNVMLAELRQDYSLGYKNKVEYNDACKEKASLQLELEAIKQAIAKETKEYIENNDYLSKIKSLSLAELRQEVLRLQGLRSKVKFSITAGYGSFEKLELEKLYLEKAKLGRQIRECQNLAESRNKKSKESKNERQNKSQNEFLEAKFFWLKNAVELFVDLHSTEESVNVFDKAKDIYMNKKGEKADTETLNELQGFIDFMRSRLEK